MAPAQYTESIKDMLLSAEMPLVQKASLRGERGPAKAKARAGVLLETQLKITLRQAIANESEISIQTPFLPLTHQQIHEGQESS